VAKSRKASTKDTLRRLMRDGAGDLARHLNAVMTSDDPAGPHKARVTLRRLRVALAAFKPLIARKLLTRQQTALRTTFRLLGTLRDADVLAAALNQPALHAAAATTRAHVRATLTAPRLAPFNGHSWARPRTRKQRNAPATRLARSALDHIWHRLQAQSADLLHLPVEARHDLRKSLKTLRYLGDAFAPLWPDAPLAAFLPGLKALQEDLGTLNDHATARSHGLPAPDDAPLLAPSQTHWTTLRASPPWWPTPPVEPPPPVEPTP